VSAQPVVAPDSAITHLATPPDDLHESRASGVGTDTRLPQLVHLSSLVERRSRASSFEKAEVELEHDQLELRSRIAWLSERLTAGAALTVQIRPHQERDLGRPALPPCVAEQRSKGAGLGARGADLLNRPVLREAWRRPPEQ
jgi:hypothetical protein